MSSHYLWLSTHNLSRFREFFPRTLLFSSVNTFMILFKSGFSVSNSFNTGYLNQLHSLVLHVIRSIEKYLAFVQDCHQMILQQLDIFCNIFATVNLSQFPGTIIFFCIPKGFYVWIKQNYLTFKLSTNKLLMLNWIVWNRIVRLLFVWKQMTNI